MTYYPLETGYCIFCFTVFENLRTDYCPKCGYEENWFAVFETKEEAEDAAKKAMSIKRRNERDDNSPARQPRGL